jgi:carboxylesterase type B
MPPFRAAIMESGQLSYHGTPNAGTPGLPYPDPTPAWDKIIMGLNCTNSTIQAAFACVQNAPASIIKNISERQQLLFSPVPDNQTFVTDFTARRRARNIARVPLLIGNNQDEGSIVGGLFYTNLTTYLTTTYGPWLTPELLTDIKRVYPVGSKEFPTEHEAITTIDGDTSMLCGTALVANDTAASGLPTWRYLVSISHHHPQTSSYSFLTSHDLCAVSSL